MEDFIRAILLTIVVIVYIHLPLYIVSPRKQTERQQWKPETLLAVMIMGLVFLASGRARETGYASQIIATLIIIGLNLAHIAEELSKLLPEKPIRIKKGPKGAHEMIHQVQPAIKRMFAAKLTGAERKEKVVESIIIGLLTVFTIVILPQSVRAMIIFLIGYLVIVLGVSGGRKLKIIEEKDNIDKQWY